VSGAVSGSFGVDEALLSLQLGWPAWVLPLLLSGPALFAFTRMVRLHPRAQRLVPLTVLTLAQGVGVALANGVLVMLA